jgi:hypothetical protein
MGPRFGRAVPNDDHLTGYRFVRTYMENLNSHIHELLDLRPDSAVRQALFDLNEFPTE